MLFIACLGLRSWSGHRLETQLHLMALKSDSELEAARDRYVALYDRAPAGYLTLDLSGQILQANRTAEKILGVPLNQLRETPCYALVRAQDRPKFEAHLALAISANAPQSCELEMNLAGRIPTFLRFETLVADADQADKASDRHFLISLLDVSERRRAEALLAAHREKLEELVVERTRELEESREALHRADRLASLGTLAAGLAHELNNPLGMIRLRADEALLERDVGNYENALEVINEQIVRCAEIVRNVLQFSRGGAVEVKVVDLAEIALRSVDLTEHYAMRVHLAVLAEVGSEPALVLGSAIGLEQVIVNLLRNAIGASSRGSSTTVALSRSGDSLQLSVSDTGTGMTDNTREHAFDPFYTTKRNKGGTGLGLSIAHGIVMAHNGELRIASQLGKGTKVTMELPVYTQT